MLYEDPIKYKELTDASVRKKVCVLFDKPLFACIRNQTRRVVKERKVELENFIFTRICSLSVGERGGKWGKQVGSMNEESQVRGCYNITFICTPTRKQCMGSWGKQIGSMNEESQVGGCCNITFICTPTRKQCRLSPESDAEAAARNYY